MSSNDDKSTEWKRRLAELGFEEARDILLGEDVVREYLKDDPSAEHAQAFLSGVLDAISWLERIERAERESDSS